MHEREYELSQACKFYGNKVKEITMNLDTCANRILEEAKEK